jgi:hypothetical protein
LGGVAPRVNTESLSLLDIEVFAEKQRQPLSRLHRRQSLNGMSYLSTAILAMEPFFADAGTNQNSQ